MTKTPMKMMALKQKGIVRIWTAWSWLHLWSQEASHSDHHFVVMNGNYFYLRLRSRASDFVGPEEEADDAEENESGKGRNREEYMGERFEWSPVAVLRFGVNYHGVYTKARGLWRAWCCRKQRPLKGSVRAWCHRISAYMDEGNSQSGFLDSRNFNSTLAVNPYRQGEESDVLDGPSYERRQHPPLNRLIRPRHLTSQHSAIPQHLVPSPHAYIGTVNNYPSFSAAHSNRYHNNIHAHLSFPPPGSVAAMNGVPSGPQTAFGDLSMAGQFIPRYNDLNRTTNSRQHVSLRASRVLPSEMLDGLRFSGPHNELINQSVPYEWTEAYDQHSDMRLDVDNMTYEELLALEERIGNVSTGLDGEDVQKCLKTTKHSSAVITITKAEDNDLKCSICQEEYEEGDELGELKCGHGYHTDCIKQWLQLKNQCPICKASAC